MGLPPEAAVWRERAFPPIEEWLVTLLERQDAWGRTHLDALMGAKKVAVPGPMEILRPGEQRPDERPRLETDPRKIAAWFHNHLGDDSVRSAN